MNAFSVLTASGSCSTISVALPERILPYNHRILSPANTSRTAKRTHLITLLTISKESAILYNLEKPETYQVIGDKHSNSERTTPMMRASRDGSFRRHSARLKERSGVVNAHRDSRRPEDRRQEPRAETG